MSTHPSKYHSSSNINIILKKSFTPREVIRSVATRFPSEAHAFRLHVGLSMEAAPSPPTRRQRFAFGMNRATAGKIEPNTTVTARSETLRLVAPTPPQADVWSPMIAVAELEAFGRTHAPPMSPTSATLTRSLLWPHMACGMDMRAAMARTTPRWTCPPKTKWHG